MTHWNQMHYQHLLFLVNCTNQHSYPALCCYTLAQAICTHENLLYLLETHLTYFSVISDWGVGRTPHWLLTVEAQLTQIPVPELTEVLALIILCARRLLCSQMSLLNYKYSPRLLGLIKGNNSHGLITNFNSSCESAVFVLLFSLS